MKQATLILSSGGARGLAQIGVIKELEDNGWIINAVAGCSIGALIGGFYAAGKINELETWMLDLTKNDIIKYFDISFKTNGFIKGEKVLNDLKKLIDIKNIEDLNIPYKAVATDITSRQPIWFDKGDLFNAIRASISIPGIFTPHIINNMVLVDGGVCNPMPIDAFEKNNSDKVIAVNLNSIIPYTKIKRQTNKEKQLLKAFKKWEWQFTKLWYKHAGNQNKKKPGMYKILLNTFEIMQQHFTKSLIEKSNPDIIVEISHESAETFDFHKTDELIKYGRLQTRKALGLLNNN